MSTDQKGLFPEMDGPRNGNGRTSQRLFIPKLLQSAATDFDRRTPERERAFEIIKKWAALDSSGKLRRKNERTLQGEFLNDIFSQALDYTVFSENLSSWNLEAAFHIPGGEADAAIGLFSPEKRDPPRVLIELKGPKCNVDRDRFNGRTPVQQCWDYLNAVPQCPWGIVCNYVSFRLYHRNKTPRVYEHFKLQDLTEVNKFREFYYIFERGAFLPLLAGQQPRCDDLLRRSETRQSEVGDELYSYYHDQRLALISHLRRPPLGKNTNEAIRIAQKLLDRIVFVAFCEDRLLLDSQTIERTYRDIPAFTLVTNPRWHNFKQLFRSVDQGNPAFNVTAFNGGLFAEDPEVDNLELHDDWTQLFRQIGNYDFRDEVNVEVLGHLFEQSITDLEAIRIEPEAQQLKAKPKSIGKRKQFGIVYTPRHITEYVVRQTIGPYLDEKFAELARELNLDLHTPLEARITPAWFEFQNRRWQILLRLRICDPACGSGAFLIEAFDFLEGIYEDVVGQMAAAGEIDVDEWEEKISPTILRQNLFGVDLSEEAVEISRLALWIRTAERGKSLADLSHNVQCGNSVVDDPAVDPLAFDWEARFPEVFAEGKFDCIIGNPPYVKLQNFRKRQPAVAAFLLDRYRAAQTGNFDLYLPFIERGLELLNPGGRLGMIAPSVWLYNEYGAGLRQLVVQRKSLERFVDFKSYQVFRDATTYTALQFFSTMPRKKVEVADASHGDLDRLNFYHVDYKGLGTEAWSLVDEGDRKILDKMKQAGVTLEEATSHIFQGLITSADAIYHLVRMGSGKYYSKASACEVEIEDEIMRPLVSGEDAVPFATPPTDTYLIFPYHVTDDECRLLTTAEMKRYRRTWEYLKSHEQALREREGAKFDDDQWYRFGRPQNIDKQHLAKLGVPQTVNKLSAFNDIEAQRYFNNVRINGILPRTDKRFDLWYILALLNSNALDFFFRKTAKPKDRNYFEANRQFIAPLPIAVTRSQKPLVELSKLLADYYSQKIQTGRHVIRRFQVDFAPRELLQTALPPKIPGKLQAFDTLPATERLDALQKFAKRRFKPAERTDWDHYLTEQADSLAKIKAKIADALADLNERVNKLYGLTADDLQQMQSA